MVKIPDDLARAIQSGDCVLWVGASFGSLAGRPSWEQLLRRLIRAYPEDDRDALAELVDNGRLRTVLTYVHRHLGDDPLAKLLADVALEGQASDLDAGAQVLAELPWRACFATTYADLVVQLLAGAPRPPALFSLADVHRLSLRDDAEPFVLRTPPTGRAMRADREFFDLVEEAVHTRTILFLGFEPDDPDLAQILELLDRIGRGNHHFAILPWVSAPQAEELREHHGIEVIPTPAATLLPAIIADLARACAEVAVRPSDVEGRVAALDLARAVRAIDLRADLAVDAALALDLAWIEQLMDALPSGRLSSMSPATQLRTGNVMLAHGRIDRARRCYQGVATHAARRELLDLAHFDLALCALVEGDRSAALDGLATCAEVDRGLALVPPRYHLLEVLGTSGGLVALLCRDRESKRDVEISVATLARAVGHAEQRRFHASVAALAEVEHPTVKGVLGGFADGRLFGIVREPVPGIVLADSLDERPMPLGEALEIVVPLVAGLEACHARSVLHRAINPASVLVGPQGPVLRGFGFPPAFSPGRPSVRTANRGYMAPEQLAGGEANAASDLYSLAALLYRLLSGRAPAGAIAPARMRNPGLDPRVDELLRAAMHPEPSERPSLAQLRDRLSAIAATPDEAVPQPFAVRESSPLAGVPETVEEGVSAALGAKIVLPEDRDDLEAWAWILERRPTHVEARDAVARIEREAREAARWDRVAEAMKVRAEHVQVARERSEILHELATLYERELGAPASAFDTLQGLLDAVDGAQQIELVAELRRLAEITGQWAELGECMDAVAERIRDPERQAELHFDLGRVFADRLGANERAVAELEKAAALRPSAEIHAALLPLYRKLGREPELVAAMVSLADLQAGAERHATLVAAAKLLRESLADEEGALGAIEIVLAEDHEHSEALAIGESLARALGRKTTLVDVLTWRAAASLVDREVVDALREAAALAEDLGDRDRAIGLLQKLAARRPDDRAGVEHLVELLRAAAAGDVGRRTALIDALAGFVDHAESPEEKAALLAESAALLDQEVDGKERAADCRERILALVPSERPLAREAVAGLERWYRRQGDREALLALFRRQLDGDEADRAQAWRKLFALHDEAGESGRSDAIDALEHLAELEPDETRWRDALLERYLANSDYKRAGPLIRAQVDSETDPKRKAELLLRGGILRQEIGKIEGAIDALEEAVRLDPTLTDAWLELRELYAESDQPLKAIEAQVAAARCHVNRVEKVKLLFEAGKRYVDDLDEADRGLALLDEVVALDPDHRDATAALLERRVAQGELARAWPLAQLYVMQVRSQQPSEAALNRHALLLAGRCALAVEQSDRAREYLEKARALDATDLDVLRLLGELDMGAGRFADALRHYQSVVLGVGDGLPAGELSRLYVRMAEARIGMDERSKAVQMFERAIEIDPDNEDAAARLAEIADAAGPAAAIKAKRRLVELLVRKHADEAGLARRVELLGEIASLQAEGLVDLDAAVVTLEEVLALTPDDPAVLHRMLDLYTARERWREALGVLARQAEAQKSPEIRAKYLFAGGLVIRDHLADDAQAAEWLHRALDIDPGNDRAFAVYVELLEKTGAWHELSRALRTKMKALPEGTPPARHVELFTRLGEVYEHLGDGKTALAAFHQAARLSAAAGESEDRQRTRHEQVIKLAVAAGEDSLDKAITHAHAVIALAPMEFETYHRLVELYLAQNRKDRARCIARALKFLKQADEAELELAASGPVGQPARGTVTRDLWRTTINHPSLDVRLGDLFALIWPVVASAEGRTLAHHRVRRESRTDVSLQSPTALSRFLAHACQVLDAPVPDLYLREDELGGLKVDALSDGEGSSRSVFASVLAGRDAIAEKAEPVLQFRCGRTIARVKPEHILASVLPSAESLRHAVWGAFAATQADAKVPADCASPAGRYADGITRMLSASRRDQLAGVAAKVVKAGDVDTRTWLTAVTHTVTRAGFVMCGDLEVVAAQLTREGDDGSVLPAKDRVRDLVAYAIGEPYLRLRKELGIGK